MNVVASRHRRRQVAALTQGECQPSRGHIGVAVRAVKSVRIARPAEIGAVGRHAL